MIDSAEAQTKCDFIFITLLCLEAPTQQNGQTHWNNLSAAVADCCCCCQTVLLMKL